MAYLRKTLLQASAAVLLAASAVAPASAQHVYLIAGAVDDAFHQIFKKGAEDAGKMAEANGGRVTVLMTQNYDNFGPDLVTLINQAVAQGADGIAIPVWVPEAQVPALKVAAEKGIKIIQYNAGIEVKEEVGAINFVGSDEYLAGVASGEYFTENGAKHIFCHIHIPALINLELRCKGVTDGAAKNGGKVTTIRFPVNLNTDLTGTAEAMKAELLGDPSIDAIMTLANWASDAAVNAVTQMGTNQLIGTFDMSPSILDRIKDGTQAMAIDQQPYLQGFLSTAMLFAHLAFGTELASDPLLTGPNIVDASNVDAAIAGMASGVR